MAVLDIKTPEEVLAFWFEELTPKHWFDKNDALDDAMRRRFAPTHLFLASGNVEDWRQSAEARLAAAIVLDQFPRNIYRGTPLAFATDWLALREALSAVASGADMAVSPQRRCFFYLPFEHSENPADQDRSVELFTLLGEANYLDYAIRHREVIREYGRFPHRNSLLGRQSTGAELAYLARPGAGF